MNIYKRIISLSVAFAMCISLMIAPASATELVPSGQYQLTNYSRVFALGAVSDLSLDYIQNIGGYLSTLWEAMKTGSCDGCSANPADGRHNFLPRDGYMITWEAGLKGNAACDCQYCGITFDEFCNSTYSQYVSSLQTDLGTSTITADGLIYYGRFCLPDGSASSVWSFSKTDTSKLSNGANYYSRPSVHTEKAPIEGYYTYFYELSGVNVNISAFDGVLCNSYMDPVMSNQDLNRFNNTYVAAGGTLNGYGYNANPNYERLFNVKTAPTGDFSHFSFVLRYGWRIVPASGSIPTSIDVTVNSRPASIVGDYGIIGDDGTIIKVDGNMIVDESTNTVYNPVTNTTNNYTDYAFDYSDRSYNLTLEDGSTLKVVYGDENVTIHEGDTIYNIYYLIPDDSGSGDDPGTGDTPGGEDMSWWKQAWTNFTDKLFSILGNGGSSINPDTAPAVPDDEGTGEKGYNVIDLFVVLKDGTWAFITGIVSTAYDGFTGFVESVSSAGSFFTFYNEDTENSLVFIPLEGEETIWD